MTGARPDGFVVAISGPSGAGKSTLAANVAARLGDAVGLNADDYDADWRRPEDVARWIAEGADPDAFSWPTFAAHLRALRAGQPVTRPDGVVLPPAPFVVAEAPFGRALTELRGCVDLAVWVDVPLEVALARRIQRTVGYALEGDADALGVLKRMDWYVDLYLRRGVRDLYLAVEARARHDCDLVLDGTRAPDVLAEELAEAVVAGRRAAAAEPAAARAAAPAQPAPERPPPAFPRKRVAAGALFFNQDGELLVVKPTYRDHWSVPGGVVEAGESPQAGCAREVREELGLDVPIGRLVAVDHTSADDRSDDSLQFLFDGGVLRPDAVGSIRLPAEELSAFRFVPAEHALALLAGGKLARRMPAALRARDEGRTVYLQDGRPA